MTVREIAEPPVGTVVYAANCGVGGSWWLRPEAERDAWTEWYTPELGGEVRGSIARRVYDFDLLWVDGVYVFAADVAVPGADGTGVMHADVQDTPDCIHVKTARRFFLLEADPPVWAFALA